MNGIHSCNYYCDRAPCIKAQRDEMRGWFFDTQTVAALQQRIAALERECEKHKNAVLVYNQDCIAAEKKIAKFKQMVERGTKAWEAVVETLRGTAPPRTYEDGIEAAAKVSESYAGTEANAKTLALEIRALKEHENDPPM